ncbi:hypothetical protein MGG_06297 [Pyricularia oryzae 70-15]|uniref:Nuclear pore complex protein An-Nup82 n=3 Tax=Pyricularia oryzae TaxID=318829 RepID=G4N871_PYRO7|nr:uncharacterized protein MGG_06297 [Pyricularia oryzae 70-15]EHA50972.1 hypothetical protein MGG_06297 [Pyricularia oryzae 70-15]ELQ38008.1 hypothetical protein OOU_Y34scaffold00559g36 [Pyricularia oryzae Y34]KAI7925843.1 hypothetical protein M9X92_003083 [Pyricularia oryzae]KAI7927109.1 hypothetical protein M0657_003373 [Pyricularia oryzae]
MVKITSYTPAWLNEPALGHSLFAPPELDPRRSSYAPKGKPKAGPRRTIARRGTEVFVANGREIRWGDLVYLKEQHQSRQTRGGVRIKREDSNGSGSFAIHEDDGPNAGIGSSGHAQGMRTIKTPVADDIRQLIVSPHSNYLAVLTAHTVHVCLLPDPSHLTAEDSGPLKAKFWTLGPTTHVTSKSAIASALWHPLGVSGSCLVTVTDDAVVRVWELSAADRWSFDSPTLAIDLRKLADGTSLDQDFSASIGAMNQGFSPDSFDMEVAAACFGGRGSGSWSSMTLWVAMRGGDVYALCPLLPQKWAPPPTLIPSLSVSVVAKVAAIEDDPTISGSEKQLAQQQLEWMSDLDSQEPRIIEASVTEPASEIYTRPAKPGAIPKLQGPFDLDLEVLGDDDLDLELTDIFVIGEKGDTGDLMMEEDEDELAADDSEGLSLSVICLVSTSGQLRICLDLDGVQAQWLPPLKSKVSRFGSTMDPPSLLTFQTMDVMRPMEVTSDAWPMFSEDVTSRYSFYITHPAGITLVSLAPWVFCLESELQGDSVSGADFRIDLLVKGQSSTRDRIYTHKGGPLSACVAINDPDLGHFVLSGTPQAAVALTLDTPEDEFGPAVRAPSPTFAHEEDIKPLVICEPRPTFQPPDTLGEQNELSDFVKLARSSKYQAALTQQEIRLSPAILTLLTNAHQHVDAQTERINQAVSELFRRLQQLPAELHEQVLKMNMLKGKIDKIAGEDDVDSETGERIPDDVRLRRRLEEVSERQKALAERMDKLKRQTSRAHSRELSDKEKAWIEEVKALEASVLGSWSDVVATSGEELQQQQQRTGAKIRQYRQRFEEVTRLKEELVRQAQALGQHQQQGQNQQRKGSPAGDGGRTEPGSPSTPNMKIPAEVRKAKIGQVMQLLERETALVEAVKSRLEKLSVSA